jgi:hypothetical protein
MRKSLLAAISLVTSSLTLFAAAVGPAAAEPARAASASAYGLSATGVLPIAPTITTSATFPPGQDTEAAGPPPTLLTVPLGTLALAGVVTVNANAHQADNITPSLNPTAIPDAAPTSNPVTLAPVNSRGLAKTAALGVLLTSADPTLNLALTLLQQAQGLLTADAVTAEAVARCVNNQPVFETGYQIAGLGGIVGGALNETVQGLLNTVLGLVSGDPAAPAPLSAIISITPGVVTPLPDGIAIDGLRISVPLLNETIVISHAEAHMPPGCGVAPATTVAPARPAARLAATGNDTPLLPIGAGLMGAGVIGYAVVRRSRRTAAQ